MVAFQGKDALKDYVCWLATTGGLGAGCVATAGKLEEFMTVWGTRCCAKSTASLLIGGTWRDWRRPLPLRQLCIFQTRCSMLVVKTMRKESGSDSNFN